MKIPIACIVEGHGDSEAVPVLIRRLASEVDPALEIQIPHPIRIPRDRLKKPGELERAVDLASRQVAGRGGVIILIDSEDDCPKDEAPAILARARKARSDVPVSVILAKPEFEAWFLAAAVSLRGKRGLAEDLEPPDNPEDIRGAKEWLGERMNPATRNYRETLDQPALAASFDLAAARKTRSFDKCYREITAVISRLNAENQSKGIVGRGR